MGRMSRAKHARHRQAQAAGPQGGAGGGWYVDEASQAEQWLQRGQPARAGEAFAAILSRLGGEPSYERAVILERLGRCLHAQGRAEGLAHITEAMAITGQLPSGDGAAALRGVLHSDLGDMLCAAGRLAEGREAYETALTIAERRGDVRAQGIDLARLGALAWRAGQAEEARGRYRAALERCRQAADPDMEAAVLHQLGRLLQGQRQWHEAAESLAEAARIREARGHGPAAAQAWEDLAAVQTEAGRVEEAEACHRKAVAQLRAAGDGRLLAQALHALAHLLHTRAGRLVEARQLAEEALLMAQKLDPAAAQAWQTYGLLAEIHDREAARTEDPARRALVFARAEDFRRVQHKAPPVAAALTRLGREAGFGRAMLLGRLGRCFHLGRRPDLALATLGDAVQIAEGLAPDADQRALLAELHTDRAAVLATIGREDAAREARAAALVHSSSEARATVGTERAAEAEERESGDAEAAAAGETSDGAAADGTAADGTATDGAATDGAAAEGEAAGGEATKGEAAEAAAQGFAITIHETLDTEWVFEPDLLLDGRHAEQSRPWSGPGAAVPAEARPALFPWTRSAADEDGKVRFLLHPAEPTLERHTGCVAMRRIRREVAVSGRPELVWRLVRTMDGTRRTEDVLRLIPDDARPTAAALLAALAATGVVDASGRPVGRWLHAVTKKGVLPGGGLGGDAVLRLATDGDYRAYPGAPRMDVAEVTPEPLHAFHGLTRRRRSRRDYRGEAVSRAEFDALLHTACGVTGTLAWMDQETKLRAYPASGALYAVEIYPAVLRVTDLAPAIYHYRAGESVLEAVRPDLDPAGLVSACLPVEREMVAGAAAMICLVGRFPRHEKKYGEGGYRMMVAEAGHISQNLVLAATALGLAARPFGGVFDDLLNRELGLEGDDEQFLLAVLVGHAGERPAV